MKYVCELCGAQLRVDRDVDDDRTFDRVVNKHRATECTGTFVGDEPAYAQRKA